MVVDFEVVAVVVLGQTPERLPIFCGKAKHLGTKANLDDCLQQYRLLLLDGMHVPDLDSTWP